jgi:arylsulfatase A-like enzyme
VPTIIAMPGVVPKGKKYNGLIANFDFYPTIAARAGLPIPDHCDGVDLVPFLAGEQTGEAHEYLFWLNNEPGDAVRRHLVAVRWKEWRLYRKYEKDPWQLFNLGSDPEEENNVASRHPEIVRRLARQHAEWGKTLAPLGEIPKVPAGAPIIPSGHGWALAPGKDKGAIEK